MTDITEAVGLLQTGVLQPHLWSQGLTALADALRADHIVGLSYAHSERKRPSNPHFWAARLSASHLNDFAAFSPEFETLAFSLDAGRAVPGETIVPDRVLFSMPLYERAVRPAGGHFSLAARPSKSGFFVACRSRSGRRFDDDDVNILTSVLPALDTLFQLKRHLHLMEEGTAIVHKTLDNIGGIGVFLLDRRGVLLHVNQAAGRLLQAFDGLYYKDAEWTGLTREDTVALRQAIGNASGSGCILRRRCIQLPLMARAIPIKPMESNDWINFASAQTILFVRDPHQREWGEITNIASALGLTHKEARLAVLLADGESLAEAAKILGITIGNARVHLKRIFAKTDTHRQAELVHLLLSLRV
jgi:DNA-binding CsgD family transcriptional regulator